MSKMLILFHFFFPHFSLPEVFYHLVRMRLASLAQHKNMCLLRQPSLTSQWIGVQIILFQSLGYFIHISSIEGLQSHWEIVVACLVLYYSNGNPTISLTRNIKVFYFFLSKIANPGTFS